MHISRFFISYKKQGRLYGDAKSALSVFKKLLTRVSIGYERGDFVEGNVIYLPLHVPLAKALFHRLPVIPAADDGVAYFFFRKGGKEIAENGGRVDQSLFNIKFELYFPPANRPVRSMLNLGFLP